MKINTGKFEGDKYIKHVDFSKAVLWKDREISLSPVVTRQFKWRGINQIIFEDHKKGERWVVDYQTAKANAKLKQVGQEPQFYMPIEIFDKEELHDFEADVEAFDEM